MATLIVMACYIVGAIVFNHAVLHRLTAQADVRLSERLADAGKLSIADHASVSRSAPETKMTTMRPSSSGR